MTYRNQRVLKAFPKVTQPNRCSTQQTDCRAFESPAHPADDRAAQRQYHCKVSAVHDEGIHCTACVSTSLNKGLDHYKHLSLVIAVMMRPETNTRYFRSERNLRQIMNRISQQQQLTHAYLHSVVMQHRYGVQTALPSAPGTGALLVVYHVHLCTHWLLIPQTHNLA